MKLRLQKLFKSSVFWLSLILAFGLWLRLYQIDQKIWLYAGLDSARDVLVAKHIVNYSESIYKGPYVAGGFNWLQNSPVYYYFLALLWFFSRSILGLTIYWAVILASGIILVYWAGKLTRDPATGLIAALIYAVHPELILEASQVFQPHLLPLFTLISYICLLKAWQNKSGLYLVVGTMAILIPIHFHYSIGLILPIFGLAIIYLIIKMIKEGWKNWREYLIAMVLSSTAICLSWVMLTYRFQPFDQFEILQFNQASSKLPLAHQAGIILQTLKQLLLGEVSNSTWTWMWLCTAALAGLTQYQLSQKKLNIWLWLQCGLFFSCGLVLLFNNLILASYFLGLLPFFIIFWATCLRSLLQLNWLLGLIGIGLILSWAYHQNLESLAKTAPKLGFAQHYQAGIKAIYVDYQSQIVKTDLYPSLVITALPTSIPAIIYDGWLSSIYWLYLEDLFGQQLVKLTNNGINHQPLQERPKFIYFACQHYYNPDQDQATCFEPFVNARRNVDVGQLIFTDEVQTIWRFKVTPGTESAPWFRTYWKQDTT